MAKALRPAEQSSSVQWYRWNTKHEVEEVIGIQQDFLQLLEQKETARAKLLTLNRAKLCWNCHSTKNLMCEDCMRAKYCSEECQEERRTGRGTMTGATRSSRGGMRGTRNWMPKNKICIKFYLIILNSLASLEMKSAVLLYCLCSINF